jgi:hypothetical protein
MKPNYVYIYAPKVTYVMTEDLFNHYIPIEVRSAASRLGKTIKRNKEQSRRAVAKYAGQVDPRESNS